MFETDNHFGMLVVASFVEIELPRDELFGLEVRLNVFSPELVCKVFQAFGNLMVQLGTRQGLLGYDRVRVLGNLIEGLGIGGKLDFDFMPMVGRTAPSRILPPLELMCPAHQQI